MMRTLWTCVMVALALLATGAELDRQSRRDPHLAALVPTPFRSFAQERLTTATVRSDDPAKALQTARLLVQRRPVPAEHLSLLAIAEERNGNRAASALLVQKAAQRGWRDPIAQQAMFDIALTAGDVTESSHRLAAIWATRQDKSSLLALTARQLATGQGRSAMAETLATGGRWTKSFVRGGGQVPAEYFTEVIETAVAKGARLNCGMLTGMDASYKAGRSVAAPTWIAAARKICTK